MRLKYSFQLGMGKSKTQMILHVIRWVHLESHVPEMYWKAVKKNDWFNELCQHICRKHQIIICSALVPF